MTRDQAISRLKKLLGPRAFATVGQALSSPERRAAHERVRLQSQFAEAVLKRDMAARRAELLNVPDYQGMVATLKTLTDEARKADGIPYYRFRAGINLGWATETKAEGDTWEQVIDKLETRKQESA